MNNVHPAFSSNHQRIMMHAQRITTHWPKYFIFLCAGRAWWYVWLGLYIDSDVELAGRIWRWIEYCRGVSTDNNNAQFPNKHDTLKQYWFNVGPPSTTLAQHETDIVTMCRVCWVDLRSQLTDLPLLWEIEEILYFSYLSKITLVIPKWSRMEWGSNVRICEAGNIIR